MTKTEIAAALRALADRIEAADHPASGSELLVSPARIDAVTWGVRLPVGAIGTAGQTCRNVTRSGAYSVTLGRLVRASAHYGDLWTVARSARTDER